MRAAVFNEPRSISVAERRDAAIAEPTDAVVRVVLACVCGSDLWYYRGETPFEPGPIGHEFVGVVEDVGVGGARHHARRLRRRAVRLQRRDLPQLPPRHHDARASTAASSRGTATAARARRCASRSPTARWFRSRARVIRTR